MSGAQSELFRIPRVLRDETAFRRWLEMELGLTRRSAGDVVSRVKRIIGFEDPLVVGSEAELRFRLEGHRGYRDLPASIRSQLKRAAVLYRQFRTLQLSRR